jgi:hypothetical protein
MREQKQRQNRIILLFVIAIIFWLSGYFVGYQVGEKRAHAKIMNYVDKLLEKQRSRNL